LKHIYDSDSLFKFERAVEGIIQLMDNLDTKNNSTCIYKDMVKQKKALLDNTNSPINQ